MPNNNQQPTKPKPDAPLFDRVATIIGQARANVWSRPKAAQQSSSSACRTIE
ncbi:MAG: hypothetical protein J7J06_02695 [Methanosarcinales archaeon]|nr:hypothetical protein [Methanosarcinales archaeon]